jgi:hypothetical protein
MIISSFSLSNDRVNPAVCDVVLERAEELWKY